MAAATVDRWNRRLGIAVGQDGSFEAPKGKPYFGYDYASAHLKAGQII